MRSSGNNEGKSIETSILLCLPDEVLINILFHLTAKEIIALRLSCKKFNSLGQDNTLWHSLFFSKFNPLTEKKYPYLAFRNRVVASTHPPILFAVNRLTRVCEIELPHIVMSSKADPNDYLSENIEADHWKEIEILLKEIMSHLKKGGVLKLEEFNEYIDKWLNKKNHQWLHQICQSSTSALGRAFKEMRESFKQEELKHKPPLPSDRSILKCLLY